MKIFISLMFLIFLFGCSSPEKVEYSFFVAGHTYGNPLEKGKNKGLYKPFNEKLTFINEQKNLKAGFLLGDVVWHHNSWAEAERDIAEFNMPVHIVRGNHDGPLKKFEGKFGKSYSSFIEHNNLFIILDPNLDKWNISGDQLIFLMNTLRNDGKHVNNIFIFSHQVLWYSEKKLSKPAPNSLKNRDTETNFWTKIEPLLRNQEKPVYVFAGDVGAFSKERRKKNHIIEYFYYNYGNITYISTGMGGGVRDNFIIADVLNNGTVNFRLIHLNGDEMDDLGELEDYINPN